jgi:hypothetical protein
VNVSLSILLISEHSRAANAPSGEGTKILQRDRQQMMVMKGEMAVQERQNDVGTVAIKRKSRSGQIAGKETRNHFICREFVTKDKIIQREFQRFIIQLF